MVRSHETQLYRHDVQAKGTLLSPGDRERLIRPYLPPPPQDKAARRQVSRPVHDFVMKQIHILISNIIHVLFTAYIMIRQTHHAIIDRIFAVLYYHHRAPELIKQDVKALDRLPQHLSVILELKGDERGTASLEALMDDVAEISAWCCCVGIPTLSVYEKTGILKGYVPTTHRAIFNKMHAYFGKRIPTVQLRAPHMLSYGNDGKPESDSPPSASISSFPHTPIATGIPLRCFSGHLSVLLISAEDGRSTMVDLTKTLTEMSQRRKLAPDDISQDLIDAEISESVMSEPDLLVLFGPSVHLQGYPPWQARLTEIFHVQGNSGVGYQVFLRALYRYANAQMKFGR